MDADLDLLWRVRLGQGIRSSAYAWPHRVPKPDCPRIGKVIADRETVAGVAERVVGRYGAHDADALGRLYSQECTFTAGAMVLRGREEITAFWQAWFEAFPDVASTNHHTLVDPPHFLFDWVEEGTHTGSLRIGSAEIAPTGRKISWRGVSLYTVDAGEIVSVLYYADQAGLMALLTAV